MINSHNKNKWEIWEWDTENFEILGKYSGCRNWWASDWQLSTFFCTGVLWHFELFFLNLMSHVKNKLKNIILIYF
jgi:hypothetical protein